MLSLVKNQKVYYRRFASDRSILLFIAIAFGCGIPFGLFIGDYMGASMQSRLAGYWRSDPADTEWGLMQHWLHLDKAGNQVFVMVSLEDNSNGVVISQEKGRYKVSKQGDLVFYMPSSDNARPPVTNVLLIKQTGPVDYFVAVNPDDPTDMLVFWRVDESLFPGFSDPN